MGTKLSDSGADWDAYQQASSTTGRRGKHVKVNAEEALRRIQQIAYDALGYRPDVSARVFVEDWRLSDSPEAAAERARFEKEQGE